MRAASLALALWLFCFMAAPLALLAPTALRGLTTGLDAAIAAALLQAAGGDAGGDAPKGGGSVPAAPPLAARYWRLPPASGASAGAGLRPLFLAARAGEDRIARDVSALDPMLVPSWAARDVTAAQLIAFAQQAVDAGGLAVFQFHGIGGEWISVSREAHRELLAWLAANRQTVWTGTFKRVMTHVTAEQKRLAAPR